MSEITVTPSLTSALMPANARAPGPAAIADSNADKAPNPAGAAANGMDPGTDAKIAQGGDASPFAAIMQRCLSQAAAKADTVPAAYPTPVLAAALPSADPAPVPMNKVASPMTDAAPVPLIKTALAVADATPLALPIAAFPGADPAPVPMNKAASAITDPALVPLIRTALAVTDPAPVMVLANKTTLPVADPAAAPVKRSTATEESAPDPTIASLAAAPAITQSLIANTTGHLERAPATEKRLSTAPKAAQLIEGTVATQASTASGAATATASAAATVAASDKAAITAALSAPTGEASGGKTKQLEASAPEGTFEGLLAAAQVPIQTHPGDARASTSLHVETPVGANGWNDKVGEQIVWMVGRQEQRAELVLNPPQLGRVEVSVSIHGDQANAQFVSANPAVRDALESALPRLREMLADAGISLGQAHVGSESANNAANQSADKQENRDNQPRASAGVGALRQMSISTSWQRQGNGMVDVFA